MSKSTPAMDAAWIERRLRLHNALNLVGEVLAIPATMALWALSFWFARFAVLFSLHTLGYYRSDWLGMLAGSAFVVVLAIEGIRNRQPLFDMLHFARSGFNTTYADDSTYAMSRYYGNPLGIAYFVSQVLCCAPRTTIMAIEFHRARLRADPAAIAAAAEILARLSADRRWTPASRFAAQGAALILLERLDLIWTRNESGEAQVRIPAGSRPE